MRIAIYLGVLVVAMVFFVWKLRTSPAANVSEAIDESGGPVIDPNDSEQLGQLIGLAGGTMADAAVAKFAIERFEQENGRRPTVGDVGALVGMIKSGL